VEPPPEDVLTRMLRATGIRPARGLPHVAEPAPTGPPVTPVVVAAHSQGSLIALSALLWLKPEERRCVGLVTFGSQLQVMFPRAFPQYVSYGLLHSLLEDEQFGSRWVNLYRETDPIAGPVLSWRHGRPSSTDGMTSCSFGPSDDPDPEYAPTASADEAAWVPSRDRVEPSGRRVGAGRLGGRRLWRACDWRLLDPTPAPGDDVTEQTGPVHVIHGHSNFFADPEYALAVAAVRART
jgi:hypothetical protein